METVYTEDNIPELEDYLEYLQIEKGTVYVCVEVVTPAYASGHVNHLEVYNRPPTFAFEHNGQRCFVANINGGDSMVFSHLSALMNHLTHEFSNWMMAGVMKGNDETHWTSI